MRDDELDGLLRALGDPAGAPRTSARGIRDLATTPDRRLAATLAVAACLGVLASLGWHAEEQGGSGEDVAYAVEALNTGVAREEVVDVDVEEVVAREEVVDVDVEEVVAIEELGPPDASITAVAAPVEREPVVLVPLPAEEPPPAPVPALLEVEVPEVAPLPVIVVADAAVAVERIRRPSLRIGGGAGAVGADFATQALASLHVEGPRRGGARPFFEVGPRLNLQAGEEDPTGALGGAIAGGVSIGGPKTSVEMGWEGSLAGDLAAAPGVQLATGPRIGVRLGRHDRPGFVAQLGGGVLLDARPDPTPAPWIGLTLAADLPTGRRGS